MGVYVLGICVWLMRGINKILYIIWVFKVVIFNVLIWDMVKLFFNGVLFV